MEDSCFHQYPAATTMRETTHTNLILLRTPIHTWFGFACTLTKAFANIKVIILVIPTLAPKTFRLLQMYQSVWLCFKTWSSNCYFHFAFHTIHYTKWKSQPQSYHIQTIPQLIIQLAFTRKTFIPMLLHANVRVSCDYVSKCDESYDWSHSTFNINTLWHERVMM